MARYTLKSANSIKKRVISCLSEVLFDTDVNAKLTHIGVIENKPVFGRALANTSRVMGNRQSRLVDCTLALVLFGAVTFFLFFLALVGRGNFTAGKISGRRIGTGLLAAGFFGRLW